jgi:alkaline phosphatase
MSKYVDGFIIPIKKNKLKAYKKMATIGRKVWMQHGALDYYECVGAKLDNEWGLPFKKLCKLKSDETVIFAFIVYKSKAHRNQVNAKVFKDSRMQPENYKGEMPFDMKRLTSGEFKAIVHS